MVEQEKTLNIKSDVEPLRILTPMSGQFIPLSAVPDPAFAEKMVGDGAAIDPIEGKLVAPIDGVITMIHPSKHAVSLQSTCGMEILMHIGVDTVKLKGEGFTLHVEEQQTVKAGDLLIEFDMDKVARQAASLITPILIIEHDKVSKFEFSSEQETTIGQPFYTAHLADTNNQVDIFAETIFSNTVKIANATGIHARPAAHLAKVAKEFDGQVSLIAGSRTVNARSVTGIMGLNLGLGDEISFSANSSNAKDALIALEQAVINGLGEDVKAATCESTVVETETTQEPSLLFPPSNNDKELLGISASTGFAVGPLYKVEKEVFEYEESAQDSQAELDALDKALPKAVAQLEQAISDLNQQGAVEKVEILSAHLELLQDPSLNEETVSHIKQGFTAPAAWQTVIGQQVNVLEGLANPLMQQRATDLRDVGNQVLRKLLGKEAKPIDSVPENTVVVAEELTPSEISNLDPSKVLAVLTTSGSASSHVAIIARSQGIPMIAAIDQGILAQDNGTQLMVDADKGVVLLSPAQADLDVLETKRKSAESLKQKALADAMLPAMTTDQVHMEVAANIGDVHEAVKAKENGADGIGLLRSEFLFLDRVSAPTEEEQFEAYSTMLAGIGSDKPAIVRTLDVGGDKPLPYVPIAEEENPFLGERGIRISLDRPELLRIQVRALLRASVGNKLRIMLPMIASLRELKLARQVLNEESAKLGITDVELGVMIEVPSAALMADVLAEEADFFSIGTNDLTQYTLAIDRGNARLASLADNLDPAVLRMIELTVKGAQKHNRWVGVCGGMAAQPLAQPILLGLGVDELSVQISAVAETKYRVRALDMNQCKALAQEALRCDSSQAVKDLVAKSQQAQQ